jgi:hypothetical protein
MMLFSGRLPTLYLALLCFLRSQRLRVWEKEELVGKEDEAISDAVDSRAAAEPDEVCSGRFHSLAKL